MTSSDPAVLARSLAGQGRFREALAALGPLISTGRPLPEALELQAAIFKAMGDAAGALEPQQRITVLYPERRSGWHNLAATQGDVGLAEEAETSARRCLTIGSPAPETQLVLGRALQSQGRFEEAEAAFVAALSLRPAYPDAHRDLAQLRWMRTGDLAHALTDLANVEADPHLSHIRASVLEFAGDPSAAREAVMAGLRLRPSDPALLLTASNLALLQGDAGGALRYARTVQATMPPDSPTVLAALIQALLACGEATEAARLAERWQARSPNDQLAVALGLTAWRALGDPRYERWADYPSLVRTFTLDTPEGWPNLNDFLDDLRSSLLALHTLHSHPLHQSLRGGSQTSQSLLRSRDPAIAAFFATAQAAIQAYLEELGTGTDPLRRRNTGRGRPTKAWSVNLRPGGRHADHVHPQGWISSAFYVTTPEQAVDGGDQAGWIRFGVPPFPLRPEQGSGLAVRPEPGRLVLFPSYMWHGTKPFSTTEQRLTIAFDVLPD